MNLYKYQIAFLYTLGGLVVVGIFIGIVWLLGSLVNTILLNTPKAIGWAGAEIQNAYQENLNK
jgi:hypothetical protein